MVDYKSSARIYNGIFRTGAPGRIRETLSVDGGTHSEETAWPNSNEDGDSKANDASGDEEKGSFITSSEE